MSSDEDRKEQRYTFAYRVEATLGTVGLVLCDIGDHGLHVRHATAIRLGTEAPLRLVVPGSTIALEIGAHVVWSRFGMPGTAEPYQSGLRVPEHENELRQALVKLRQLGAIRLDEKSLARKRAMLEEKARLRGVPKRTHTTVLTRLPDDVILLVKQARQRLQASPTEMVRWFNRAKFSLNATTGAQIHEREDVLAVWEYLERSIELPIIARALDER